jgi:hypothetical protein
MMRKRDYLSKIDFDPTFSNNIKDSYWDSAMKKIKSKNVNRKSKTLSCDINTEDIKKLFFAQNCKCAISGLVLSVCKGNVTASLDRIDSSKGYEIHNIQWIHKVINKMKRSYTMDYFIKMCKEVASYKTINKKQFLDSIVYNDYIAKCEFGRKNYKGLIRRVRFYVSMRKAIRKGIDFSSTLTPEFVDELYKKQKGMCALTGKKIILRPRKDINASLDRIDSNVGYIENNVQWIHKDINFIKSNLLQDDFLRLCDIINNYNSNSSKNIEILDNKEHEEHSVL